jgi:hypothetical protein
MRGGAKQLLLNNLSKALYRIDGRAQFMKQLAKAVRLAVLYRRRCGRGSGGAGRRNRPR